MAKIDLNKIDELKSKSFVYTTQHPVYSNLILIKYLDLLTYSGEWCDTSKKCRGLVVDIETSEIIVHSMSKFFNMEEHTDNPVKGKIPIGESFKAYDKRDGCLAQLGWYKGNPIYTSSGSFTSEHAQKMEELLNTKYKTDFDIIKTQHQDKTFIFELESPLFRIVLDNGTEEKLVLLAIKDTDTGKEYDIHDEIFTNLSFERPEMYDIDSVEGAIAFQKRDLQGKEGIILLFESGFRVKLKYENYLTLHRFFTCMRRYDLWKILKEDKTMEIEFSTLISKIPDEFYQSVKEHEKDLKNQFTETKNMVLDLYNKIVSNSELTDRKSKAQYIIKNYKNYSGILFGLLDGKNVDKHIWDLIEPDKTIKLF